MIKKLYVGNLPYNMNDEALKELFSQAGAVDSAVVITDRMSGRSKGFGFVEMATEDEAQAAIDQLNGKDQGGRPLTVNESRPREEGGRPGGNRRFGNGGGGGGGGRFRQNY